MQSKKTHEQELRIIEKRENTANAGPDFDPREDLDRSPEAREAFRKGETLRPQDTSHEDLSIVRGVNQESRHHKGSGKA